MMSLDRPDALFVAADAFFTSRRVQLISLAARHALPAVDKILRGAKPGEIPVEQPTKFAAISDAVANNGLKTAANRRSHCSVPDGMQWTTITSSRAAISGRAARKSAAIPFFRHHRAADLAGGAVD
jgi:hypothetical protein